MGKTPWFLQNVTFGWGTGMDWDLTALFSPLLLFNRFVFFILSSSSSLPLFKEEDCDGGGEGHFLHFHIWVFTQFLFFWLLSILIFLFIPFLLFLLLLLLFSLMLPFKGLRQRLVLFWHFFRFCLLEDLWCGGGLGVFWPFLLTSFHSPPGTSLDTTAAVWLCHGANFLLGHAFDPRCYRTNSKGNIPRQLAWFSPGTLMCWDLYKTFLLGLRRGQSPQWQSSPCLRMQRPRLLHRTVKNRCQPIATDINWDTVKWLYRFFGSLNIRFFSWIDFVARVFPTNFLASSSLGKRISHNVLVLVRIFGPIWRFFKASSILSADTNQSLRSHVGFQ